MESRFRAHGLFDRGIDWIDRGGLGLRLRLRVLLHCIHVLRDRGGGQSSPNVQDSRASARASSRQGKTRAPPGRPVRLLALAHSCSLCLLCAHAANEPLLDRIGPLTAAFDAAMCQPEPCVSLEEISVLPSSMSSTVPGLSGEDMPWTSSASLGRRQVLPPLSPLCLRCHRRIGWTKLMLRDGMG